MQLKAAVVGTGFIGPVHIEGLRRLGVEVVGILGSSGEKSKLAAKQHCISRGYESFEQLLDDSSVDVVHITSPNQAHFEQASQALKRGKHVLCEKPLAMDSTQSAQLVQLARESGVAAGVNYNIRYYPLCLEAAEQRKAGKLGTVNHVSGSYVQDWLFYPHDFNWRVLASEAGALRAVADIGTHWLDLIHAITGLEVDQVMADLQTVFPQRQRPLGNTDTFSAQGSTQTQETEGVAIDTEDTGSILLRFKGGARGIMWVSQVTAGRKNCLRWEISGSNKAMSWNSESPNELWNGYRDRPNEVLTRDPALLSERASNYSNYPGGHNEGFPDTFKQLFRDYYGSIENGTYEHNPTFPTFMDGHREILICEAILASSRTGQWTTVPAIA